MTKIVSWNINKRFAAWKELLNMDVDVALLQEAGNKPPGMDACFDTGPQASWDSRMWNADYGNRWGKAGLFDRWCKIVKLSDRVDVKWFKQISPIGVVAEDEIAVSGIGTIAAARVTPQDDEPFIVVSMYARWLGPHPSTKSRFSYPDGAAHNIISDISAFVANPDSTSHRIIAAGDLNMVYGVIKGDDKPLMTARERSVWERMNALGLEFMGPFHPNGRKAKNPPDWIAPDSLNVPTYHSNQRSPDTALDQLDYAFASRGFHKDIKVSALNDVDEWGSSDHCRLLIEVGMSDNDAQE